MIKYKGLLACRTCETVVDKLALLHHTTPLPNTMHGIHDRRSQSTKRKAQIETRNTEIIDGICAKLIEEAIKEDDKGNLQMHQLHCDRIVEKNEKQFAKFLTSLVANESRLYAPVDSHKDEKTGKITPKFAFEHESDLMCKKFCVEKNSMKDQMTKMREDIKRKQQELADNISITEILSEALGLLVSYWYISVTSIIALTALGVWLQIKFLAPRDASGRPILSHKGFSKANTGRRLGEGKPKAE
eukprot:GDKK01074503.1.p1 GENE.GDKK01074503.1~~GDKK01074503.1.p1  ORF type:complete len:255 (+),score=27.41 GDKK01074503.1:35-766(+)